VVREHGPVASQGRGRDARAELRDIPLQVCTDEVLAPAQAVGLIAGQQAVREAAPHPQVVQWQGAGLQGVDGTQLQIGDAARQGLSGLFEQVQRGGTQQQEPA